MQSNTPSIETDKASGRAAAIGAALKAWMDHAGMTVLDLYKASGISRETIYRLLKGKKANPSFEILSSLAEALSTTPGTLLDGDLPMQLEGAAGKSRLSAHDRAQLAAMLLSVKRTQEAILRIQESDDEQDATPTPPGKPLRVLAQ